MSKDDTKRGRFIDWDFNAHRQTNWIKQWDKLSKYFVLQHKYFVIASEEIDF
jgi:hypothetical protein